MSDERGHRPTQMICEESADGLCYIDHPLQAVLTRRNAEPRPPSPVYGG